MLPIIIPALLWAGEHVLGPLEDLAKDSIETGIKGLGGVVTAPLILEIFEKVLGPLEDTKKQQLTNELAICLGQQQIILAELNSPKKWYQTAHGLVEMAGAGYLVIIYIILGLHFVLATVGLSFYVDSPNEMMVGAALMGVGIVRAYKAFTED